MPPITDPNLKKVQSAARAAPLAPDAPQAMTRARLQEGAADVVLNAVSILRDVVDDFRNSDRFFKYKALVLSSWLVLSVTSVGAACPRSESNEIGARLVVANPDGTLIYMVKNSSERQWDDVEVVVNGAYRSTAVQISPNADVTLSPIVLFDSSGKPAPKDLKISEIEVRAGDDRVTLLKGGQVLHK